MIFDQQTLTILARLLVAAILSGFIGVERQLKKEPAGFRTHMLVCLGSALFTVISIFGFPSDPARLAANIITGIGFLGAGAIFATGGHVKGLTTAASLWATAAIGVAAGMGMYTIAVISTLLILIILELWRIEYQAGLKEKQKEIKK